VKGLLPKPKLFRFFAKRKKDTVPENQLPKIHTKTLPGPKSLKLAETLRRYECPQITYVGGAFPIFFSRSKGANLYDVDGNRYLDLSSCFAVSGIGHSDKAVAEAMWNQSREMMHGMGDVHPNEVKVELAKKLAEITPGNLGQTIFSSTGSEAVETALKTAVVHTKKSGVIAFDGAYHGLGYGALQATHRQDFKKPFEKQLGKHVRHAPFPDPRLYGSKASETAMKAVEKLYAAAKKGAHPVGAVLVEPIQGRGGVRVPPANFLKDLRAFCDANGVLLIADEVLTGFGRTGAMFAVEKSSVVPDLLCLGKGMANGFPISACVGTPRVMHSWGASTGDAVHTSTYLGHPTGCAAALATIRRIEEGKLVERSRALGEFFRRELHGLKTKHAVIGDVRGSGLMIGIELVEPLSSYAMKDKKSRRPVQALPATAKTRFVVEEALRNGIVLLGSGPDHNVLSLTPPFVITERDIAHCIGVFDRILKSASEKGV